MKKYNLLAGLLVSGLAFAQTGNVGIGTQTPTRNLHIEGDLRIRNLENKAADATYTRVLAVDNSGNIDYINKSSLLPDMTGEIQKTVINNEYTTTGNTPTNTNTLKCGRFEFAFISDSTTGLVRFRLNQAPATNVKVYTTFEQNFAPFNTSDGFQFEASTSPRTFTTSNAFIDVPVGSGQAQIANGEYNELYITYPGDAVFYRVSFYRVNQNGKTHWVNACETF